MDSRDVGTTSQGFQLASPERTVAFITGKVACMFHSDCKSKKRTKESCKEVIKTEVSRLCNITKWQHSWLKEKNTAFVHLPASFQVRPELRKTNYLVTSHHWTLCEACLYDVPLFFRSAASDHWKVVIRAWSNQRGLCLAKRCAFCTSVPSFCPSFTSNVVTAPLIGHATGLSANCFLSSASKYQL